MQQEGAGGRQADATLARMCRHLALPSVAPHSLRLRSLIVFQFSALLNFSLALFLQFCLIFRHVTCLCRAKASAGCLATCCSCSLCHQLFNGSASQMANVLLASPARARVPAMSKSISYAQPFAANQFHLSHSLAMHTPCQRLLSMLSRLPGLVTCRLRQRQRHRQRLRLRSRC